MKRFPLFFAILLVTVPCFGQSGEFKIHSNGLMYSAKTMNQLEFIVDSLNIKFRMCDLNKTYYSKAQGQAHFVHLEKRNIKEARNDIKKNMPFDDFIKKHHNAIVDKDLIVVKFKYHNYQDKEVIDFYSYLKEHEVSFDKQLETYENIEKGTWVFDYSANGKYTTESIRAFYFTTALTKKPLPETYARMVQYSDCMVDTSTQIFKENAKRSSVRFNTEQSSKVSEFLTFIHEETAMPDYEDEKYWEKYRSWDSLKFSIIDTKLLKQKSLKTCLMKQLQKPLAKEVQMMSLRNM